MLELLTQKDFPNIFLVLQKLHRHEEPTYDEWIKAKKEYVQDIEKSVITKDIFKLTENNTESIDYIIPFKNFETIIRLSLKN